MRLRLASGKWDVNPEGGTEEMPMYEYRCSKCGEEFELLRTISERDDDSECPKCGHTSKHPRRSSVVASFGGEKSSSGSLSTGCSGGSSGFG